MNFSKESASKQRRKEILARRHCAGMARALQGRAGSKTQADRGRNHLRQP
jgi:hypothetical protein